MRPFLASLLAVVVVLWAASLPAVAQTEPPAVNMAVDETADQQYHDAVALLRNGRKFEVAIAKLRNAVQQTPNNSPYHLALGCALVSRAISIADAARQATEFLGKMSDYEDAVALWETAQTRRGDALYKQPRPLPPLLPATKDDGKAFKLSKEQAEQTYNTLGKEAIGTWEAGFKTARTDDEKAQAYQLTGWGKSLLRTGTFDLKLSAELQKETTLQKCTEAANAATAFLPNDAAVWRGVGDIALFDYYAGNGGNDFQYNKKAAQAYERSLTLNKKAVDLWYVLFLMESRHGLDRADAALNQALRLDRGNTFLWYEKAYFIPNRVSGSLTLEPDVEADAAKMNEAQWIQVLSAIEQGNAAGRFQFVGTNPQPPLLLASAWKYCAKNDSRPMYRFVTVNIYLSGVLSKNIAATKKQNDTPLSQRWSQAAVGMGQILSRDVLSGAVSPASTASSSVSLFAMEGKFALQQGYDGLIALRNPGSETARALRKEKQRITEVIDGWSKAYMEAHKSQFSRASGQ